MSKRDRIAMLICYALVILPTIGLLWAAAAPDEQVAQVLAAIDSAKR